MQIIDLPGHFPSEIEFPDDMSSDEIQSHIKNAVSSGQIKRVDNSNSPDGVYHQNKMSGLQSFLQSAADSPVTNFALGAGDKFSNSFRNIANMFVPESVPQLKSPLVNTGHGDAYDYGKIAGDIGAFGLSGIAGGGALRAAESIPYLGKLAAGLGGAVPGGAGVPLSAAGADGISMALGGAQGVARRGLGAGLYGASQSPDDRMQGAAEMGGASLAADALLGGAGRLLPHKMFAGRVPAEELIENLRLTKGTETGIGNVIQSPALQRMLENNLPKIPFSGAQDASANVAHDLNTQAKVILNDLSHGVPEKNISSEIGDSLHKVFKEQTAIKNKLYEEPEKKAEELGYKIFAGSLGKTAKKYLDEIESKNILDLFPEERSLIKRAANLKEGLMPKSKVGLFTMLDREKENVLGLKEANMLKGKLSSEAKQYFASGDPTSRRKGQILSEFSKALKNDINTSLDVFSKYGGHPEIKEKYMAAEKNYAQNFSKFLDKDIYKFLGGGKSPEEIVSSFIKTGISSDKSDQVRKLMNVLPEKTQDLVKYSYLSRALENGKVDPSKLKTLFGKNKLGPNQMDALFNRPGESQKMYDFMELSKLNSSPLNRMLNPNTGQKATDSLTPFLGGSIATTIASLIGGPAGVAAGAGTVLGGARGLTNLLTNEKMREKLVKAIIADKQRGGAIRPNVRRAHKGITVTIGDALDEDDYAKNLKKYYNELSR
jgi:hypothetical protein